MNSTMPQTTYHWPDLPAMLAKLLRKASNVNPVTAYYHVVSDTSVPHVDQLYSFRGVADFKKDIDTFCRKFRIIGLSDLLACLRDHRPFPPNSLLLTFDDGFREMYDIVAPILRAKGVTGTFFIATAFLDNQEMAFQNKISLILDKLGRTHSDAVRSQIIETLSPLGIKGTCCEEALRKIRYRERAIVDDVGRLLDLDFGRYLAEVQPYLTSDQVSDLIRMGFSIGGHSVDHPLYSDLSLDEQVAQTSKSVGMLRERFSLNYSAFAFPHGDEAVTREFFDEVFTKHHVDVTFGTRGIMKNILPRHFQRFSMERTTAPAERIVFRYSARRVYKRFVSPRFENHL